MGDERLVKHAVKVQFENNDMSNLLKDAPPTNSFQQLVNMAKKRALWKQIWEEKHGTAASTTRVEIQWNDDGDTTSERFLPAPATPAPKRMTKAEKQEAREAHAALFNPKKRTKEQRAKAKRKRRKRKRKRKGLEKPPGLTDKQRKPWARDHFDLNHIYKTPK